MQDIHALMKLMVDKGASDLFLTCGAPPHIKIDGVTHPVKAPALEPAEVKQMACSVMTDQQFSAFEDTLEANLSVSATGLGRFRINVYYQRGEVAVVARLIKAVIPSFDELGLPKPCTDLVMLKRGLVLVVGAAGSGKSTSLAAMIGYRSEHVDGHILTIEDPIEFLFPHKRSLVDQREVGIDTRSFNDALVNAMREAPDVIMIGEIRDVETAKHAISYAETGHLCLATMHANNANQAIERILNFFPEQAQKQLLLDLSLNLKGVISQRLIPSLVGKRALCTELLLLTPYISDLIQQGRIDEIREVMGKGSEVGMHTFDQMLFELYQNEKIDLETALHNADSHSNLALRIRLSEKHSMNDSPSLQIDSDNQNSFKQ
ncbi:PilT/PilU family type 4a pilus ATPase [Zhongshania aquatica]|uniref:PilT/PilU family type 4a pilus ATPase n=1 Tax=Zhongshania aquatica TaxID=2965069 RepID=UPI0022B39FEB|nr:PilT/PilU family type 4a pilus ATPase [Marortus sp. BJYM1]